MERIRVAMRTHGHDALLVCALDEVAWTLNLRGKDVPYNPVFSAYLLVQAHSALLFINGQCVSPEVAAHLKTNSIQTRDYDTLCDTLKELPRKTRLALPEDVNAVIWQAASGKDTILTPSPVAGMKAVKNATEIRGFRQSMLRDGVAMVKFLRWLKPAVKAGGVTESGAAKQLDSLRAESEMFRGLSFGNIVAYKSHAAIVHYETTPETDIPLHAEGLLLMDTGAQYADGTTDITRTVALGDPTEEEKHIYTLVLKGHIALSRCRFPTGTCGTQLDLAARYAMWQEGLNYGHGTGHGVGSFLCVHEGPHQIRMNHKPAHITAGMTVTDEPGLYLPGKFGVRTENILLCVPHEKTEFGQFFRFEPLTLCPIDKTPIDRSMLDEEEKQWLNDYHARVREQLTPLLHDAADKKWLAEATAPI